MIQTKIEKLIWSGIPTALNACSWTLLTMQILQLKIGFIFVLLSGFTAWIFYTKDRLNFSQEDLLNNKKRVLWYQKFMKIPYKIIITLSLLLLVLIHQIIPLILIGTLLTFIYTTLFKISKKVIKVKNLFLGKVIFVNLVWLLLTVYIPAFYYGIEVYDLVLIKISMYIFIIIGIQIINNDIDDIIGDEKEKVKTIPVLFGLKKTRVVLAFLVLSFLVIGWGLFPLISLMIYTILLFMISLSYGTSFSYILKFSNISLGHVACIIMIDF